MSGRNILITGGAGFIGSNIAVYLKRKYQEVSIIALDNLRRRGSELNVPRLRENNINFIHGDIRNKEDLSLNQETDLIIECSADPSILSGFSDNPEYVVNTNLLGTVNCLEFARKKEADIIFLSTGRVYPYEKINSLKVDEEKSRFKWGENQSFPGWSEEGIDVNFPLDGPRSLYGATKLASEILLIEYINMYRIKGIINRCGVIAGPWQFGKVEQGVFSLWMLHHYFKKNLNYIGWGGTGKQVRDLLHVDDLVGLIDLQINDLQKGNGKIYNVGGGKDIALSLLQATELCEQITGNRIDIGRIPQSRPADVCIYVTDNRKVNADYNWQPNKTAREILEDMFRWIDENREALRSLV